MALAKLVKFTLKETYHNALPQAIQQASENGTRADYVIDC